MLTPNVFLHRKFIKNQYGAPCTMVLKKDMRKACQRHDDIQILGYTVEEESRIDRFLDSNNEVNAVFPLVDNNITKKDTLTLIQVLGIDLNVMYKLGYQNANCVGCVKGGWVIGTESELISLTPSTRWQNLNA